MNVATITDEIFQGSKENIQPETFFGRYAAHNTSVRDHFIAAEISNPFYVVAEKRKLYATHELPIRKPKVNKIEEGRCPDDEHRFFGGNL